jgi:drug/metabolite transporter (DMT)-like permease
VCTRLFNELRGAQWSQRLEMLGGAAAIMIDAYLLAYATTVHESPTGRAPAALGILAALGAALLWGTRYIPYRKACISGMNPLSFVTVFTFGELGTMFALAAVFDGGPAPGDRCGSKGHTQGKYAMILLPDKQAWTMWS